MYYIQYVSLIYGLFIDIKHVTLTQSETLQTDAKFKKLKSAMYFLNKDILFDICDSSREIQA